MPLGGNSSCWWVWQKLLSRKLNENLRGKDGGERCELSSEAKYDVFRRILDNRFKAGFFKIDAVYTAVWDVK